jgi:hypothetical protein
MDAPFCSPQGLFHERQPGCRPPAPNAFFACGSVEDDFCFSGSGGFAAGTRETQGLLRCRSH